MGSQLQYVCDSLGCSPSYAVGVLEKLRNDEALQVEDYTEFRVIKEIAKVEGLKVRYKERTGRVIVQRSF